MTTTTETKMLLLTKDDFDAVAKAASSLSSLLWRMEHQREIKVKLPLPPKATIMSLAKPAAVAGRAVDYDEDF